MLELLILEHLKPIYKHFVNYNIQVEMYASDWIFTLFSNVIPIGQIHHFFYSFFKHGWIFFYKFSLTFLKTIQQQLLEANDLSEILTIIKLKFTKADFYSPSKTASTNLYSPDQRSPVKDYGGDQYKNQAGFTKQIQNFFNYIKSSVQDVQYTVEDFKDETIWAKIA